MWNLLKRSHYIPSSIYDGLHWYDINNVRTLHLKYALSCAAVANNSAAWLDKCISPCLLVCMFSSAVRLHNLGANDKSSNYLTFLSLYYTDKLQFIVYPPY